MCGSTSPIPAKRRRRATSRSPDSVPASDSLNAPPASPLMPSDFDPLLWCMLSGKSLQRPYSWLRKTRPITARLSGTILQPSTATRGVDSWMSQLRASRAPLSAVPANDSATKTPAHGEAQTAPSPNSCESFEKCAPPWCSSKMFQSGLQAGIFSDSEKNYQTWVSMCKARSLSLLNRLRQITGESVFLSWQSPAAGAGGSYSRGGDRVEELLLGGQVQNWPTATMTDARRNGDQGSNPHNVTLNYASENWPTAAASDGTKAPKYHAGGNPSLNQAAKLWATPNVRDRSEKPEKRKARQPMHGGKELGGEVRIFPCSHQDKTTGALGLLLSVYSPPSRPRLNPAFQWFLMGHPWQLLTCSASEAMASWFRLLHWHFMNLLAGLEDQ
jgi:hypothetical protein